MDRASVRPSRVGGWIAMRGDDEHETKEQKGREMDHHLINLLPSADDSKVGSDIKWRTSRRLMNATDSYLN